MRSPGLLFPPSTAALELSSRGCTGRARFDRLDGCGCQSQIPVDRAAAGLPIVVGGAANGLARTLVDGFRLRRQGGGAHATTARVAKRIRFSSGPGPSCTVENVILTGPPC